MKKLITTLLALLLSFSAFAQEEELLEPEKAFALTVTALDANTIEARWDIAEGYYLYRSKFKFKSDNPAISLGEPSYPAGKIKHDEFFGDVETYRGSVVITIPVERAEGAPNSFTLTATSQGCADLGVCYPPQRQSREVALVNAAPLAALTDLGSSLLSDTGTGEILEPDQAFRFDALVEDGNALLVRWDITPGHYLYKDKFRFTLTQADGVTLGQAELPKGEEKDDEFFGRIEVYHTPVEARLPLLRENLNPTEITLLVSYQGCAEIGICYPPQKKSITLALPAGTAGSVVPATMPTAPAAAATAAEPHS